MSHPPLQGDNHPAVTPQVLPPYGWYPGSYPMEEEVNLLDYFRVLRKHLVKIILITFFSTGAAAYVSLKVMKKKYKAEVTVMSLSQSGGGGLAALAAQVSSIPLVGGQLGGMGGQKNNQIMALLKSRTLIEKVVTKFDLMKKEIFTDHWDEANNTWILDKKGNKPDIQDAVEVMNKKILKIEDDKKTGLIKLKIELKDKDLVAPVANYFLVELQDFINKNDLTVAKRNRIFIEDQLQKNRIDLLGFGKKLNQFYSVNRISNSQPQLDVNVGRPEEPAKASEMFQEDSQQLKELNAKLSEEERTGIVRNVPSQVYLQYLTLQRELLGKMNAVFTQQYEMARVEESKEELSFQIIDPAITPNSPSSPKTTLNVAIAFMVGLFFSIFFAFFLEFIEKAKQAESQKVK